jgi:AcrR family transcriptional regulator
MPKIVDAAIQRGEIRAAARQVFARHGVRGAGLGRVAELAGMGRSSLYHYYPDKRALLSDMVSEMLLQERDLFRACLRSEGSAMQRIEMLARSCAALFPEWAVFGRVLMDLRLEDVKGMQSFFRAIRSDLSAVVEAGQADGSMAASPSAEVQSSALIGAIDGLLLQYYIDPAALPAPDELAGALVELTRRMVAR